MVTVEQRNSQTQQDGEKKDSDKDEITNLVKNRLQVGLVNLSCHTSGPNEQARREQD